MRVLSQTVTKNNRHIAVPCYTSSREFTEMFLERMDSLFVAAKFQLSLVGCDKVLLFILNERRSNVKITLWNSVVFLIAVYI